MTTHLPPQDPPEQDTALPGEAELSALYRLLPQSEPGAALDAAVMRAAAQALASAEQPPADITERRKSAREPGDWVHPKPGSAARQALDPPATSLRKIRPRWLIGLSSAATLVLAAGLAWHMRELPSAEPAHTGAVSMQPAAPALPATSSVKAMPAAPPATVIVSAPNIVSTAPPPRPVLRKGRESASPPPPIPESTQMQQVVAAAPSPPAPAAPSAAPADLRAEQPRTQAPIAGPAREAYAPAEMAAPTESQPVMQQRSGMAAAPAAKSSKAEAAPVPMSMPAPPPAPAPVLPMPPAPVAAAPASMPAPASVPAASSAADATTTANASDTPAQELDKIRQLFAQGHDDDARQRLIAFQKAHPQWPLPAELRAQLQP